MPNVHMGGACPMYTWGVYTPYVHGGCTHNACMGGAHAMRTWRVHVQCACGVHVQCVWVGTCNPYLGGAHAMCAWGVHVVGGEIGAVGGDKEVEEVEEAIGVQGVG